MNKRLALLVVLFTFTLSLAYGTIFTSVTSGNWFDPNTWGVSYDYPGPNDDVYIAFGHSVDLTYASEIWVRSLSVGSSGDHSYTANLIGPDYSTCYIYVENDFALGTTYGSAQMLPGLMGELYVQVGGGFFAGWTSVYDIATTTMTATAPTLVDYKAPINVGDGVSLQTVFQAANSNVILELQHNIHFSELSSFGFTNCKLDLWNNLWIINAVLQNCEILPRSGDASHYLSNCHLYSCNASNTVCISGPVALMDNGNYFNNLFVYGGSLWGNYGTNSQAFIAGSLDVSNNSSVSAGSWGTLDLFIGGSLYLYSIGVTYAVNNTYFNGDRPDNSPQTISTGTNVITGNFINQNSHLRLNSSLAFSDPYTTTFIGSYLDTSMNTLLNCNLTNSYLLASTSFITNSLLSSCVFESLLQIT